MTKKILITGGDGFTGRHAVNFFQKKGYNVYSTSRKIANEKKLKINLLEKQQVDKMLKHLQPDYLLHLAGQNDVHTSWVEPLDTFEMNVVVTLYLLEAVRRFSPETKMLIIGSVLEENLNASISYHPYGLSKSLQLVLAKKWADYYKLKIVMAKPVNLIGPGVSNGVCAAFAKQIACMETTNKPIKLTISNLHAKRDFLDVRDAICAYEILLRKGKSGKTYDVGTGKMRTLIEIVNIYNQISNISVEYNIEKKPMKETKLSVNPLPIMSLGWKPTYTLTQSLTDCLHFYRTFIRGVDNIG